MLNLKVLRLNTNVCLTVITSYVFNITSKLLFENFMIKIHVQTIYYLLCKIICPNVRDLNRYLELQRLREKNEYSVFK